MTNRSNRARLGCSVVSRQATGRRLLILGCIAAVGLPGAAESAAQELAVTPSQAESSLEPIAQAIALDDQQPEDAVAQTAGGVLDQIFGSQPAAPKSAKDDGRRAYPLPPPDPSSVNWSGIPYHRPMPGAAATAASEQGRPIRDVSGTSGGSSVAMRHSSSTAAGAATRTAGLPQPPQDRTQRAALPSSRPTAVPAVPAAPAPRAPAAAPGGGAARIASSVPAPPPESPASTSASTLSTNSSSRRSGRRPIDPLSSDDLASPSLEVQAEAPQPGLNFQSIARREIEPSAPPTAAQVQPQVPAPAKPARVPPSLAVINEGLASQHPAGDDQPFAPRALAAAGAIPELPARNEPAASGGIPSAAPEALATVPGPLHDGAAEDRSSTETSANQYIGSGVAKAITPAPATDVQLALIPQDASTSAIGLAPFTGSVTNRVENAPGAEALPRAVAAPVRPGASDASEFVARGPDPRGANTRSLDARSLDTARTPLLEQVQKQPSSGPVKQLGASELPGIRVLTEGPSEILIRELTQYEVRVENRGAFDATGVVISTTLPPWAEVKGHNASGGVVRPVANHDSGQLEWTVDHLPAGVVERLFVRVKPTRSGSFDVATSWTTLPVSHTAEVTVREPKLAIQIEGPNEIIYGQSQKYRVRVLNPGDAVASNVLFTLVPEVGDSVQQAIGNIPAGKEASFDIELTARDLEQLKIHGTVTADLDLNAGAKKSVAVAAAMIEATLSGPPLKFQNSDAAYHLRLINTGRASSEAVTGEIHLPLGMKYLGGIEGARMEGERLVWTIGALPPGETKEYNFTCKMEQTGNHPITFNCTGSAAGRASVEIDTAVQAIVDLKLAVTDPPAPAAVGAEVFYEVVINNRGSKAAEDVRVVAQFSNGIEPVRVEGHAGDLITGQVLFNAIPRIDAGNQVKLRIAAKADRAGDHRFRAEVRSGETVLVAEEATLFVEVRTERVSRSSSATTSR